MANTPNLDLVKPDGTDHALVSVINANSVKIDSGFGTLSEQIAMNALGTKTTVAALESALATLGGSMPNNSVRNIVFAIDPAQGVFKNAGYVGAISRTASGRYTVLAQSHSSVQSGDLVVGVYANSAWAWDNVSLTSVSVQNDKGGADAVDFCQIGFNASNVPELRVHNKVNNTWYHETLSPLAQATPNDNVLNSYTQLFDSDASSSTTIVVSGSKMIDQYRLLQFELFTASNVIGATLIVDPRVARGNNVHRIFAGDTSIWAEFQFGGNSKNITINRTYSTTVKLRCFGID